MYIQGATDLVNNSQRGITESSVGERQVIKITATTAIYEDVSGVRNYIQDKFLNYLE